MRFSRLKKDSAMASECENMLFKTLFLIQRTFGDRIILNNGLLVGRLSQYDREFLN